MMTSVLVVVSISSLFQIAVEKRKKMLSRRVGSGFQSGQETQFLFSEKDVRDSETDFIDQSTLGKQLIPSFH